jgi:protein-disulfide isomerase
LLRSARNDKNSFLQKAMNAFILIDMPVRKQTTKTSSSKPVAQLLSKVKSIKLRAPKSYTPVLIVLLIVAAFLVGMLFTKVQYLEQNNAGALQAGTQQPAQQGAQPPAGQKVDNLSLGHFPALGNKDAKVHIVEFADLRCPFCEQFFTQTEPQIIKDYVDSGKATFSFRQYAFLGPASTVAADAAECANDQGKFWDFHNYMYQHQPAETDTSMYNTDSLTTIAGQLGMNTDTFRNCLNNKTDDAKAAADMADGQKAGVNGTPTIFVNGIPVVGAQPYSAFQTIIDQELAKAK